MIRSKAALIRDLLDEGKRVGEIAKLIGCRVEYVRAVRSRANAEYRQREENTRRALYNLGSRPDATRAAQQAFRLALKSGATRTEAHHIASGAFSQAMIKSGRVRARAAGVRPVELIDA